MEVVDGEEEVRRRAREVREGVQAEAGEARGEARAEARAGGAGSEEGSWGVE